MKIAITGASGFVGRALVEALAEENHELRLLMHRNRPSFTDNNLNSSTSSIRIVSGDVHDIVSLKAAFEGVNVIYHLVGIISETRRLTFERTVAAGTKNVIEAAVECGVKKIIYLSALGTSDKAASRYYQSKWRAEESIRNSGINFIILRPSVIFGPGDKFLNMISGMIRKFPLIPIIGDGEYQLQPIYLDDLIKIMVDCLNDQKASDKTIELGGPEIYSYKEIVRILKSHLNKKRINIYLPMWLMRLIASIMEKLIKPAPLTTDQLKMLKAGNYCNNEPMREVFKIDLTYLAEGLKKYMR